MSIGFTELVLVLLAVLAFYSPDKLVEFSGKLGKALREFKKMYREINEEVVDPVKDAVKPIQDEVVQPIKDLQSTIENRSD